jgi:hypothetical protein
MFHPRNISTVLRGSGGWLAAALLATSAVLIFVNLVWAQQTSTEAAVPAPSLTAEADNGTVELNWTAVTDAERYELWVWTSADGWQQIGGDSLTDTTYSHTELTTGTTYHYTVRAVHAGGVTGPWSEYVSATFDPPIAAPTLTAQAGEGEVELSWGMVQGAERYELWDWTNADGWQQIGGDNLTGTTYSHTGLTAGTTYYYTVRAVNAGGVTGLEYVSATFDPPIAAPTLTAQAGEGEVELSWGMVQGAERYELWDWTNADGWQQIGGDNLTGTTYSHTGLTAGTTLVGICVCYRDDRADANANADTHFDRNAVDFYDTYADRSADDFYDTYAHTIGDGRSRAVRACPVGAGYGRGYD